MKKRMTLNDLKVTSFLTSHHQVRGGINTDDCVPLTQEPGTDSGMIVCESGGIHCSYNGCTGFHTQHNLCSVDPQAC